MTNEEILDNCVAAACANIKIGAAVITAERPKKAKTAANAS